MSPPITITEDLVDYEEPPEDRPTPTQFFIRCCDWWEDAVKQLQAIRALPTGWDSYGAPPPDSRILHSAMCLLAALSQVEGLAKPHINPTRNGGAQFEWEAGDRYFELEVLAERAATYLYCDDAAGVEEAGEVFEQESLDVVVAYIQSVAAVQ